MSILLLGSTGYLGSWIRKVNSESYGYTVVAQSRKYRGENIICLNPFDDTHILSTIQEYRIKVVVNLISCTDVEKCQSNTSLAYEANVRPVVTLKRVFERCHEPPKLIHISTDHVYSSSGYHMESQANPVNIYAQTKYQAESLALSFESTVLRTNFVGRPLDPIRDSLCSWLVRAFRSGLPYNLYKDVFFSPVHVEFLAATILTIVNDPLPGVFNLGSRNGFSKATFANYLAASIPTSMGNYSLIQYGNLMADFPRPLDMRMDCSKFIQAYSIPLPSLEEVVARVALDYR